MPKKRTTRIDLGVVEQTTKEWEPKVIDGEMVIALQSGWSIHVGPGKTYEWGGYVCVYDSEHKEVCYWDIAELEDDPEATFGAIMMCAAGCRPE